MTIFVTPFIYNRDIEINYTAGLNTDYAGIRLALKNRFITPIDYYDIKEFI